MARNVENPCDGDKARPITQTEPDAEIESLRNLTDKEERTCSEAAARRSPWLPVGFR